MSRRKLRTRLLRMLVWGVGLGCTLVWLVLLAYILVRGLGNISAGFFTNDPSFLFSRTGIRPYLMNTLYVAALTMLVSLPLGIGASIFINMYLPGGKLRASLQFMLDAVLGLPTVVIGLFGLTFFCRFMGLKTSLLAGALTMSITMIPLVMYATRVSLKAVPTIRLNQAKAMGATQWQLIWRVILPECLDGIRYTAFLILSRIIAESAIFLYTAGAGGTLSSSLRDTLSSSGSTLSVYLYTLVQIDGNLNTAFAVAAVLVVMVFVVNQFLMSTRRSWKVGRR